MSDGVGKNGRESAQQNVISSIDFSHKRVKCGRDEFGRAAVKITVAQVCESEGYHCFQQLALETLSNVAARYIESLGKCAKFHANLAGRTGCNIFDILQSLEDFAAVQGFPGASEMDRCVASSGAVKELICYATEAEEIPFAYDVPQFPIVKDRKLARSFWQAEVEPPGCHIPSWLPAFPDPVSTPEKVGRGVNSEQTDKIERLGKRKEEFPLLSLHQRKGPSDSAAGVNPFLPPPLHYGEVKSKPVVFPRKPMPHTSPKKAISKNHLHEENHVLEREKLTHTAKQLENHSHALRDDKSPTTLTNQRAVVKFRIRVSKKYHVTSTNPNGEENCLTDSTAPFAITETDDKRDDMKLMAGHNLKGSMENREESE